MQTEPIQKINLISDLPKITSFIFPKEFEPLPNTSEVFELEFAFYESKFLSKDEIIKRGAFLKVLTRSQLIITQFVQTIVLSYGKGGQK